MKPSVLFNRTFMMWAIFYFLIGALSAVGCGFNQPPATIQYYILDYTPPDPIGVPLPVSIHVKRFQAQSPYDSRRIVYAESEFQRTTYGYHQWMTSPANMLTDLLVRDLRAANFAQAIVMATPGREASYIIEGTIEGFYENDIPSDWQAVLSLTFTLLRTGGDNTRSEAVVLQKTYRQVEQMERNNPVSLARAMSKAMQTVSADFMEDAYSTIASSLQ